MTLEVAAHIISKDDFNLIEQIGSGTFGDVFLAIDHRTGQRLAVKVLKNQSFSKFDQITFMREVEILSSISYPSILPFIGFSLPNPVMNEPPSITTLFADGGSLDRYINIIAAGGIVPQWGPTQKTIEIIGIAAAMRYLHKQGIIHRDLKPANVLLNAELEPFVCDFGLSKFVGPGDEQKMQTSNCGTPVFMAPELFFGNPYSMAVDVYAFGMTLYNILTCLNPFYDVPNVMTLPIKVSNGERPLIPETVPRNYACLIEQCWEQDPCKRPSFEALFNTLTSREFYLEGSDNYAIARYISKLIQSETKGIADYQKENDALRRENAELRRQIKSSGNITPQRIGVAQRVISSMQNIFEKKIIYSRSSFDMRRCLGLSAPGFFGISGTPNLFVRFDFMHPIVIKGLCMTCYDDSFSDNWNVVVITKHSDEIVAFSCKDNIKFAPANPISVDFAPIEACSIRIEKTGLPNSISFNTLEFFDIDNNPVFAPLIAMYGTPYRIPVNIVVPNYFTGALHLPTSEVEVFTMNKGPQWLMLELESMIKPTGYRIKRDVALKLRGWDLIASNDGVEWDLLDRKWENVRGEFGRISEFQLNSSIGYSMFKLIPSNQTWEYQSEFNFFICHFDVFD